MRNSRLTTGSGTSTTCAALLKKGDQIRTGNTLIVFGRDTPPIEKRRRGVRVVKKEEIDAHVERTVPSSEDSMIMAVPEPSEAATTQLKVVYELTKLIGSIRDRQELLERVMDVVFDHFEPDRGFVLLQDNPEARPDPIVVRHKEQPEDPSKA